MDMIHSMRTFSLLAVATCLLLLVQGLIPGAATSEESKKTFKKQWKGDFDEMRNKRKIRVLAPYSKTFYYLDGAKQKGLIYDIMVQFEKYLREELKTKHLNVKIVIIPTPRDKLLSDLVAGYGDLAIGNLTITDARKKLVDFSTPINSTVDEILITGADEPAPKNIFDLAGRTIFTRKSSSYYESLLALNTNLKQFKKKPFNIVAADEYLEDEDLLEMVNAGLIPAIVMDSHKAELWAKVYKKVKFHPDVKIRSEGKIAWAFRKNSPKLAKQVNAFLQQNRQGTLFYNMIFNRYLGDAGYLKNNTSKEERKKFEQTVDLFEKYGEQYDFDFLLLMAMAYQESGLDQSRRSKAGAVGIMQILPSTAADPNVAIKNINRLENNIHAGTKYLDFMINRYFENEKMDLLNKGLFAIASYNAGPAKVARLRREAEDEGLDPNVWFNNVEVIAAKRIGRETVQYVSNIYKYYIAYKLIDRKLINKQNAKSSLKENLGRN